MNEQIKYPVAVKRDDETVVILQGYLEKEMGEPEDTLAIYSSAIKELRKIVDRGDLPADTFKVCDSLVIERPSGVFTRYTDEQIHQMQADVAEKNKYNPTKDSRVLVYKAGGITGGLIGRPVDTTLDVLSESDFARVTEIIDLLQTPRTKLEKAGWVGDFGYYVRVGDKGTNDKDMKYAFKGGPFSHTPVIVEELKTILEGHMRRPEPAPRVAPATRRGPSGTE